MAPELQIAFWVQAASFGMDVAESVGDQELLTRINSLRSEWLRSQEEQEAAETSLQDMRVAAASKAHGTVVENSTVAFDLNQVKSYGEFGYDPYRRMDPWNFVVHWDIERLQTAEARQLVASMTKAEAHRVRLDEEGEALQDEDGNLVFVNETVHRARHHVRMPYLNAFEPKPRDAAQWADLKASDPDIAPSDETHERLWLAAHQLAAIANMVDHEW